MTNICRLAEIPEWRLSSGSTEPRGFLVDLTVRFDLPHQGRASKPAIARAIVESAGLSWLPRFESRGSTITLEGLERIWDAVVVFISHEG